MIEFIIGLIVGFVLTIAFEIFFIWFLVIKERG